MTTGVNEGVIAPKALIIPRATEQLISGAIYISGGTLYFIDYNGTARPKIVTAT